MEQVFMLVVVILGIKIWLSITPTLIKKYVPKRKFSAEEVIKCHGMIPEKWYEIHPEDKPIKKTKRRC